MRFGLLLALMVTGGALMGVAVQALVDPHAQNSAGPQTQEISWAKIKLDISDLNPIKLVYDEVMKQVTTDANRPSFALGTPVPMADFSKVDEQYRLTYSKVQRMNGSGNAAEMPETDPR